MDKARDEILKEYNTIVRTKNCLFIIGDGVVINSVDAPICEAYKKNEEETIYKFFLSKKPENLADKIETNNQLIPEIKEVFDKIKGIKNLNKDNNSKIIDLGSYYNSIQLEYKNDINGYFLNNERYIYKIEILLKEISPKFHAAQGNNDTTKYEHKFEHLIIIGCDFQKGVLEMIIALINYFIRNKNVQTDKKRDWEDILIIQHKYFESYLNLSYTLDDDKTVSKIFFESRDDLLKILEELEKPIKPEDRWESADLIVINCNEELCNQINKKNQNPKIQFFNTKNDADFLNKLEPRKILKKLVQKKFIYHFEQKEEDSEFLKNLHQSVHLLMQVKNFKFQNKLGILIDDNVSLPEILYNFPDTKINNFDCQNFLEEENNSSIENPFEINDKKAFICYKRDDDPNNEVENLTSYLMKSQFSDGKVYYAPAEQDQVNDILKNIATSQNIYFYIGIKAIKEIKSFEENNLDAYFKEWRYALILKKFFPEVKMHLVFDSNLTIGEINTFLSTLNTNSAHQFKKFLSELLNGLTVYSNGNTVNNPETIKEFHSKNNNKLHFSILPFDLKIFDTNNNNLINA